METKDELLSECEKYFEKVMQDYNQHRNGRSLRKYCKEEGVDYEYKKNYSPRKSEPATEVPSFIPLTLEEKKSHPYGRLHNWCCPLLMEPWLR